MNAHFTRNLTKLAVAVAAILAPAATHADTFNFHVDLNVAGLSSGPDAPFFLDFQLNKGNGSLLNSVVVNNFHYTIGSATGSPTITGLASGTMSGLTPSITLNESSVSSFNDIFQGFSSDTTFIGFDVSLTQNSPGTIPDQFVISILDSEVGNFPIATTDFSGSSMATVSIGAANVLDEVHVFQADTPWSSTVAATKSPASVPEPSSVMALVGGVGCLMTLRRRRAQKAA
jgi:hypothetical protein